MVRTKVEIKKIEKVSSRQVTFSKRRTGVIKKAYELCILCDIDIALILFSHSGKLSLFSGKKRVEDVLVRYVCLPEHERSQRIQNPEFLQMNLERMKSEIELAEQLTNPNLQAEVQELEKEIDIFQHQLDEVEKQLRIFEGDPLLISTLQEATSREQILQKALLRVKIRKQMMEEKHATSAAMTNVQPQNTNGNEDSIEDANEPFQLLQQDQILKLLRENGLIPMRTEQQPLPQYRPQESPVDHAMLALGNDHLDVTDHFNGDNPTNGDSTGDGTTSTPIHYAMSRLGIQDVVLQNHEDEFSSNYS